MNMDRHTLKQIGDQVDELNRHGSPSCIRQARSIMTENFQNVLSFALDLTKPKPKHTIADNYPAGGLTASEPCMFCKDYADLQDELANRWIPVSERLPEAENHPDALGYSKFVLCYNPDLTACHKANIGGHLWVDIYNISSRVWKYGLWPTHWMPISKP